MRRAVRVLADVAVSAVLAIAAAVAVVIFVGGSP